MASIFGKFFGKTVSEAAGFAAGVAVSPILHPGIRDLQNEANQLHQSKVLEPGDAAAIVAEDVELRDWGANEASQTGVNGERFDALLGEALNAPGTGQLFELWRRGLVDDAGFVHGLRKAKLEPRWDTPLQGLHDTLLSSEELAMLQQQGFIGPERANSEGLLQGVTAERQQLRFEASGLPPGVETALDMLRRSIIDAGEFAQIVREGHTKTKYTDELLALRTRVLSAANYAELWLRGWITEQQAKAGGALTGYDADAMDLLYLNRGRPATTRQAFIGYTRGGRVAGESWDERETHRRAVAQSNIRTEWEPVLWAQRYTYPSAFVLRNLTQSGDITQAQAEQVLLYEGWEPGFAAQVSKAWATASSGAGTSHVAKAQTQLWARTHTSYLAAEIDEAEARQRLPQAGVPAGEVDAVLNIWNHEREVERKQLTPAQIKKAWAKAAINVTTGAPWTQDEALAALIGRGYSPADAQNYLNIP